MTYVGLFFTLLAALIVHSGLQMALVVFVEWRAQKKYAAHEAKIMDEMKASGKMPMEMLQGMIGGNGFNMSLDPSQVPASGTNSSDNIQTGQYL